MLALLAALSLQACAGGANGIEELWQRSLEAEQGIASMHMEVFIDYENTGSGAGQIQASVIDINGDDVHASSALFGQSFSELIIIGGRQYSLTKGSGEWMQQAATMDRQSFTRRIDGLAALPSMASSARNLGQEELDGEEVYHLSFTLSPDAVKDLYRDLQASQLAENSGGDIDVWVRKDTGYRVKYETLIRNAGITQQIGCGDMRETISITRINEPVEITLPERE